MICLSLCRQEAVCGDVGETAVRHRCQKNVWTFREYRGVHSTQRAWRSQQRCASHIQIHALHPSSARNKVNQVYHSQGLNSEKIFRNILFLNY